LFPLEINRNSDLMIGGSGWLQHG